MIKPDDIQQDRAYSDGEGLVYVVTAVCRDVVTYTAIHDTCDFVSCLRYHAKYTRTTREQFASVAQHEVVIQPMVWRKAAPRRVGDLLFTCYGGCDHEVTFPRDNLTQEQICKEVTAQTGVPASMVNGAIQIDLLYHKPAVTKLGIEIEDDER
jgi:hypothetical protein